MNRIFTKKFRNIVLLLIALFILLFIFRLGYGYTLELEEEEKEEVNFGYFEGTKSNYASDKYSNTVSVKDEVYSEPQGPMTVDQKYEKIAEVKSETHQFEEDEEKVRKYIEDFNGLIQYERKLGNAGRRQLQFQIGVPPDNFDSLYAKLVGIGIIHSREIIKNDKTNEYLELNARKASLEKTLESLINFKEKGGRIEEYVNLENRILEIEEQLQNLGVNLGDFDKSNEFCTIKFALSESTPPVKITISFYHRVKVALEWTIAMYLPVVTSLFLILLSAFLIVLVSEKISPYWKKFRGGN